jgi:FdhE protein
MPLLCCPYCGESDHQRLGSLIPAPGGEVHHVSVCMTCKGYLKVLTTLQKTPGDKLVCDDLQTVNLDIAALERGYLRPTQPGYAFTMHVVPQPGRWRTLFAWRAGPERPTERYDHVTTC